MTLDVGVATRQAASSVKTTLKKFVTCLQEGYNKSATDNLPADIISEDISGPYGYADDIWLCAWVADIVRREVGSDDILT